MWSTHCAARLTFVERYSHEASKSFPPKTNDLRASVKESKLLGSRKPIGGCQDGRQPALPQASAGMRQALDRAGCASTRSD